MNTSPDDLPIEDQLANINAKLSALEHRFAPVVEQAARAIDDRLRNGLVPIIRCLDSIVELRAEPDAGAEQRLAYIANELESVLESLDIERFELDSFDPSQQRVLEARPTADPGLDGTIAASVRVGYRQAKRVIRQQYVILYKYQGAVA